MPKNNAINLLPGEEFEVSTLGRILHWAMGTFRIIVIVTEMIVMGAFLSRFWLDAQNSDLNDSINIKVAQISAQSSIESQFRGLQTKLAIFTQIAQNPTPSQKVANITSKIPPDVTLSGLTISDASIAINGVSNSEAGISQFISNLEADKTFKTVNLGQLNSSEINPSQTNFSINITY
ncbi:MAG: PilN domain-containing protein [Candidatus Microgenomates bacterium]|jgi:Tfp pilus assembly protein PilN